MDVFIEGLMRKENSELFRSIHGEAFELPLATQLQIQTLNTLRVLDYHFVCANSENPKRVPPPVFIPLPGETSSAESANNPDGDYEAFKREMLSVPASDLRSVREVAADNGLVTLRLPPPE